MSGNFDDDEPRWSGPRPGPDPGPAPPSPTTEAADPITSLGDAAAAPDPGSEGWDPRRDGDRRRPTTAEQAVPWLIGLLLGLTGIVVVLLALIFIGPDGVASLPSARPSASATSPASLGQSPVGSPSVVPTDAPTASPPPTFGALEMTFQARATATSPIRLSRRDFSTTADPAVIVEDPKGVERYAWAPDGRVGVAMISRRAVALVAGQQPRTLIDPVDALVFAADSTTVYGLRIARDGNTDRAEVLKIAFDTGATQILTTIAYPHPQIIADPPLREAQFADDGGVWRLYVAVDGSLVAWILGAPASYRIDPATGSFTQVDRQPVPWSPDQRSRISLAEALGTSTLTLLDKDGLAKASVKVIGLVSHIRWAGSNNEIVFTLGRQIGSEMRQDLFVWDLVDGKAPSALTSNGASFGAEWLGVLQSWLP